MPNTREVDAAHAERVRRMAEQAAAKPPPAPKSATARRTARADAAHAAATSPAAWLCHRPGCPIAGVRQPAADEAAAIRASSHHQGRRHPVEDPPANLEEQRAAWIAAGRPPFRK